MTERKSEAPAGMGWADGISAIKREIWTDWFPTLALRVFGVGEQLQQRWRRYQFNSAGAVTSEEFEWRNVPHVYGEPRERE